MASAKESPLDVNETDHSLILMRSLDLMRKQKQGCDLKIKVDGEEIQVHRVVMSAMSDYFKAMFAHDTVENRSGVVEMKGVGFKFVTKGVEYIYGGKVSICEDDCEEFLVVATMMQLPLLSEKIEKFLAPRLNPKKFFSFKRIAEKFNCKYLESTCKEYALVNLGAISEEDEFEGLEMAYISFLIKSEESPYSEDARLLALLQWIGADAENRKCQLINMMKIVNLEKISSEFRLYLAENFEICYQSAECMKLLLLTAASSIAVKQAPTKLPFSGANNSLVLFDKTAKALQIYWPTQNSWAEMTSFHGDMCGDLSFTAVALGRHLYVLAQNKSVFRIDIVDKDSSWIQMKDMLVNHSQCMKAATHKKCIYLGGNNSLEKYDECKNEWENVDRGGFMVNRCAIVEFSDCIYVVGGCSSASNETVDDVSMFSPASSSWSSVASMNVSRENPAAVVHDEKIYVTGGFNGKPLQNAEYYDPISNIWIHLNSMNMPRRGFSLLSVCNKLFAVDDRTGAQNIETYDFQTKSWMVITEKDQKIEPQATVSVWLPVA